MFDQMKCVSKLLPRSLMMALNRLTVYEATNDKQGGVFGVLPLPL